MLKAIAQGKRAQYKVLEGGSVVSAAIISALLALDPRVHASDYAFSVAASVVALMPFATRVLWGRRRIRPARIGASVGLTLCALATSRIGGAGYLVSAVLMASAAIVDLIPPRVRSMLAGAGKLIAALIAIPSLFDPAGGGFIVAPVLLPLFTWWVWTERRTWVRWVLGLLAGVMTVGATLNFLFLLELGHGLAVLQPAPTLLLLVILAARRMAFALPATKRLCGPSRV